MAGFAVVQMSLAQSAALAGVAATADSSLFGGRPVATESPEHVDVSVVLDEGVLHVLVPSGTWVSFDSAGAEIGRHAATRAEVMTVQLRASRWWASMRRLLEERGLNPSTTVLGDGFDDEEDVDIGVLVTADGTVISWRRRYDDERPEDDHLIEWDDITDGWAATAWHEAVRSALDLQADGLERLRPASAT